VEDRSKQIPTSTRKHAMQPETKHIDAFPVMGTLTRVDYDKDPNFGKIWKEYAAVAGKIGRYAVDGSAYGVSFGTEVDGDVVDYLAGNQVKPGSEAPEGLVVREVPAATYAVFGTTHREMHKTINHALREWLPSSEYECDDSCPVTDFLRFPPKDSGQPQALFHVPVRKTAP
jgi:predicted transcriptional regulator YdeE